MNQEKSPIVRILLATALGIALAAVLGVLAIQIIEFRFYEETDSVWPNAVSGSRASSTPTPAPFLPTLPAAGANLVEEPSPTAAVAAAVPESIPEDIDIAEPAVEIKE